MNFVASKNYPDVTNTDFILNITDNTPKFNSVQENTCICQKDFIKTYSVSNHYWIEVNVCK